MASVIERINQIKQPYGGYVKLSAFEKVQLEDGAELNAEENVSGSLMGTAADYLVRLAVSGKTRGKVYSGAALRGALTAEELCKRAGGAFGIKNAIEVFEGLLCRIKGSDD